MQKYSLFDEVGSSLTLHFKSVSFPIKVWKTLGISYKICQCCPLVISWQHYKLATLSHFIKKKCWLFTHPSVSCSNWTCNTIQHVRLSQWCFSVQSRWFSYANALDYYNPLQASVNSRVSCQFRVIAAGSGSQRSCFPPFGHPALPPSSRSSSYLQGVRRRERTKKHRHPDIFVRGCGLNSAHVCYCWQEGKASTLRRLRNCTCIYSSFLEW